MPKGEAEDMASFREREGGAEAWVGEADLYGLIGELRGEQPVV